MRLLVTGASGFIGSAMLRKLCEHGDPAFEGEILAVKATIRQSELRNLRRLDQGGVNLAKYGGLLQLVNLDLTSDVSGLCEGIDWVIHLAGRTHVDHSIKDPWPFIQANVIATHKLLEDARKHKVKKFIQISTDEVLGQILDGAWYETAPPNPRNPYAASKLAAEGLAISYAHTYGLHTIVTRTENNFGVFQHPQKVFPTFVRKHLAGEKLPVYGDGGHIRQWLWVDDHCEALLKLLKADTQPGEIFHIAGNQELTNLELAHRILDALGAVRKPEDYIEHIPDHDIRPGHDRRYALNCDKIRARIGWRPEMPLEAGIKAAVNWYRSHMWWLR